MSDRTFEEILRENLGDRQGSDLPIRAAPSLGMFTLPPLPVSVPDGIAPPPELSPLIRLTSALPGSVLGRLPETRRPAVLDEWRRLFRYESGGSALIAALLAAIGSQPGDDASEDDATEEDEADPGWYLGDGDQIPINPDMDDPEQARATADLIVVEIERLLGAQDPGERPDNLIAAYARSFFQVLFDDAADLATRAASGSNDRDLLIDAASICANSGYLHRAIALLTESLACPGPQALTRVQLVVLLQRATGKPGPSDERRAEVTSQARAHLLNAVADCRSVEELRTVGFALLKFNTVCQAPSYPVEDTGASAIDWWSDEVTPAVDEDPELTSASVSALAAAVWHGAQYQGNAPELLGHELTMLRLGQALASQGVRDDAALVLAALVEDIDEIDLRLDDLDEDPQAWLWRFEALAHEAAWILAQLVRSKTGLAPTWPEVQTLVRRQVHQTQALLSALSETRLPDEFDEPLAQLPNGFDGRFPDAYRLLRSAHQYLNEPGADDHDFSPVVLAGSRAAEAAWGDLYRAFLLSLLPSDRRSISEQYSLAFRDHESAGPGFGQIATCFDWPWFRRPFVAWVKDIDRSLTTKARSEWSQTIMRLRSVRNVAAHGSGLTRRETAEKFLVDLAGNDDALLVQWARVVLTAETRS